jgi:hypothetical protein
MHVHLLPPLFVSTGLPAPCPLHALCSPSTDLPPPAHHIYHVTTQRRRVSTRHLSQHNGNMCALASHHPSRFFPLACQSLALSMPYTHPPWTRHLPHTTSNTSQHNGGMQALAMPLFVFTGTPPHHHDACKLVPCHLHAQGNCNIAVPCHGDAVVQHPTIFTHPAGKLRHPTEFTHPARKWRHPTVFVHPTDYMHSAGKCSTLQILCTLPENVAPYNFYAPCRKMQHPTEFMHPAGNCGTL